MEDLAKRAERENIANHGFALVMSNGPKPDGEALEFMQKYVDGEWTLRQSLDALANYHGLNNLTQETANLPLVAPEEAVHSSSSVDDPDEQYWNVRLQRGTEPPRIETKGQHSRWETPDLFEPRNGEESEQNG